jgi:uncharacterized membrane-anchored protein
MLVIIPVFWLLIIGVIIAIKEFTLITGNEIVLKVIPVDPRDLFRGDYVILRYDISRIDTSYLKEENVSIGSTVYVVLNTDNKHATIKSVQLNKPESGVFIQGKVKGISSGSLTVEYGIESYFVPEGKGKYIESIIHDIDVVVSVDSSGNTVIKELYYDSQTIQDYLKEY